MFAIETFRLKILGSFHSHGRHLRLGRRFDGSAAVFVLVYGRLDLGCLLWSDCVNDVGAGDAQCVSFVLENLIELLSEI